MEYSFVASVTQLNRTPVSIIEKGLPHLISCVSHSIHDTAITENDSWSIRLDSCLKENIFQGHLRLHHLNLKAYLVHKSHLVRLNEATALHHHGGCLRYKQDLEALIRQVKRDSG